MSEQQPIPPYDDPEDGQGVILVVDDTLANLRLLTELLQRHGYRVRPVTEGAHALASAQTSPPDLILLDILMPGMDGYEVCRLLKEDERTAAVPVLFISALQDTEDKIKGFESGAVDYITKPFRHQEVLARVGAHLGLSRLQRSLERQIEERDRLISELDAYAHTVAHDLKNPLNIVSGYAEMLALDYGSLDGEQVELYTEAISRGTQRMARIIDSLLLLASARGMPVTPEPLRMDEIVDGALARLDPAISTQQAEIWVAREWPVALGHAPWVEEVWANYVGNALKYGGRPDEAPPAPPVIELGADPATGDSVRFWVRDNGRGLTPAEQSRLFVPFSRLHHLRARGYGLGLSIVQRIVERLGGAVGVESAVGQGSLFYFTLPAARES